MAAAKPVVATDVGGAREAIIENESGFLVASNDDETMARRLIELLDNPGRIKAMGERGKAIAEKKFSVAAQREKTLRLYETLLCRKKITNQEMVKFMSR